MPHITLFRRRAMAHVPGTITLRPGERLRIALAVASPSDLGEVQYQKLYFELNEKAASERFEIVEVVESATRSSIDALLEKNPIFSIFSATAG